MNLKETDKEQLEMIRIAVDAMGGDNAPGQIVAGAVDAAAERPDAEIRECI